MKSLKPSGQARRLASRKRDDGIGCGRQAADLGMRYLVMAGPAGLALALLRFRIADHAGLDEFRVQLRVAADAVVHDDRGAGRSGAHGLGLGVRREDRGVVQAVHGLEEVLGGHAGVGDMAVVAGCPHMVGTAAPRGVVRRHDVAVRAGRWVVREIRDDVRCICNVPAESSNGAAGNEQEQLALV